MKRPDLPLTISACYKMQGSLHKSLEAWRILRAAVSGKELDSNVVSKFEEEFKAFINASIEKPTVLPGYSKKPWQPRDWMSVSYDLAADADIAGSRQAPPQKATLVQLQLRNAQLGSDASPSFGASLQSGFARSSTPQQPRSPLSRLASKKTLASMDKPPPQTPRLVELQSRDDALGCAGSSSSGVDLQPGSASSSADQQVHRSQSSPASKKTLKSSLPQVLDGYRNDEKIVIQVASALKLLSASTLTIIRMEEILANPGAIVLEPIFRAAIEAQHLDHLTAMQMIAVLNEFVSVAAASPLPAGSTRSATHQLSVQPPHYASAMTASFLPENTETLKNMNASTAKHAKWYVRILDPKIISYKFRAKEKEVNATKFQCILVSKDPSEYMLGLVAFEFKDIQGAKKAFEKFKKVPCGKSAHHHSTLNQKASTMAVQSKQSFCSRLPRKPDRFLLLIKQSSIIQLKD